MREYKAFPISNFRTGFDQSVEPWLLPRDAYQQMINAHLYRGVLEKIDGYTLFANFSYRIIEEIDTPDGVTLTWTGTLTHLPMSSQITAYGTIVAGSTAETFQYDGDASTTVVNLLGSNGGTGTVDITTGDYSITFGAAPPLGTYSCMFISYDYAPTAENAIMGIKPYFTNSGGQDVLVFDQVRVGKIKENLGQLAVNATADNVISELPHDYYQSAVLTGNGGTAVYTSSVNATALAGVPIVPGTVFFKEYESTGAKPSTQIVVRDNGQGGLTGTGVTSGSINYVTGAYTITFTANVPNLNYYDATEGIYGDLFTGGISNFFSLTNYQYNAFFCNFKDPIFYYDGTSVHYLNTNTTVKAVSSSGGKPTFDISTCLHVFTNRERLLLISPTVNLTQQVSGIWWSVAGSPLDFTSNEFLIAPTSEPIRAIGFINSDLVVRFSNSERVFRYTGDAFSPFRWDSTNNIWACDAPYSSINYDSWFSSVGRPAIVGSDAVNVKRVDNIIPDFTDPSRIPDQTPVPYINQTSIQQCYGERFDDLKEGWLCYNSSPAAESTVTGSDNVLAYNYLDNTYAVYSFPFSCLGFGKIINVPTWGTIYEEWGDMNDTWGSYQWSEDSLLDLGGDAHDKVYQIGSGNTLGDGTSPVLMSVISKNLNPFIEQGELCRLGYVDLFVSANQQSKLRVQFYLNDQLYVDSNGDPAGYYQETTLTFTPTDGMSPTTNQIKVWKRIYVGSVAKAHTIRFYQNADDFTSSTLDQPIYIHSMVLWAKPAGRIFN